MSEQDIQLFGVSVDDSDEHNQHQPHTQQLHKKLSVDCEYADTEKHQQQQQFTQDDHSETIYSSTSNQLASTLSSTSATTDPTKKKKTQSRHPILPEGCDQISSREWRKINKQIQQIENKPQQAVEKESKVGKKKVRLNSISLSLPNDFIQNPQLQPQHQPPIHTQKPLNKQHHHRHQFSGKQSPRSDSSAESDHPRYEKRTAAAPALEDKRFSAASMQANSQDKPEIETVSKPEKLQNNNPEFVMHPQRISISVPSSIKPAVSAVGLIVTEDDSELSGSDSPKNNFSAENYPYSPMITSFNPKIVPAVFTPNGIVPQASPSLIMLPISGKTQDPQVTRGSGRQKKKLLREGQMQNVAQFSENWEAASTTTRQFVSYASSSSLSHDSGSHNNFEVISTTSEAKSSNGRAGSGGSSTKIPSSGTTNSDGKSNSHSAVVSFMNRPSSKTILPSLLQSPEDAVVLSATVETEDGKNMITIQPIKQQLATPEFTPTTPTVTSLNNSNPSKNIIYLHRNSMDDNGVVTVRKMQPLGEPIETINVQTTSGVIQIKTPLSQTAASGSTTIPWSSQIGQNGGGVSITIPIDQSQTFCTNFSASTPTATFNSTQTQQIRVEGETSSEQQHQLTNSAFSNGSIVSSVNGGFKSKKNKKKDKFAMKEEAKMAVTSTVSVNNMSMPQTVILTDSTPSDIHLNSIEVDEQRKEAIVEAAGESVSSSQNDITNGGDGNFQKERISIMQKPQDRKLDADYRARLKRGPLNSSAYENYSELFIKMNDYYEYQRRERELQLGKFADDIVEKQTNTSSYSSTKRSSMFQPPPPPSPLLYIPQNSSKEEFVKNIRGNLVKSVANIEGSTTPVTTKSGASDDQAEDGEGDKKKSKVRFMGVSQEVLDKTAILQDRLQKKFKSGSQPKEFHQPFSQLHEDFAQTFMNKEYCSNLLKFFNFQQLFKQPKVENGEQPIEY